MLALWLRLGLAWPFYCQDWIRRARMWNKSSIGLSSVRLPKISAHVDAFHVPCEGVCSCSLCLDIFVDKMLLVTKMKLRMIEKLFYLRSIFQVRVPYNIFGWELVQGNKIWFPKWSFVRKSLFEPVWDELWEYLRALRLVEPTGIILIGTTWARSSQWKKKYNFFFRQKGTSSDSVISFVLGNIWVCQLASRDY